MVDISIIIVNYNVKHFLAQCLASILNCNDDGISKEIIVVDNASEDGSFPFLDEKFGDRVTFLKNQENVGFGTACNIGLANSHGEFILFLNPDTLVPPGTLQNCIKKMRASKSDRVAALGVKIIDGSGNFLPESKRSLPTVWNSFCKMSGLASLFPGSSLLGGYNLTFLPENEIAEIEALCGAFMFIRKELLDELGGFDEQFFMYGEDLDLCKRINEKDSKILYYPDVHIVHFKGESQKSKDVQYYKQFYSAMSIYADKHFSKVVSTLLKLGIFVAGSIAFFSKKILMQLPKLFDLTALIGLVFIIKIIWATYVKGDQGYYNENFLIYAITFPLIVLFAFILSGYYKPGHTTRNIAIGYFSGVTLCLIVYALFPENLRFSRSILLFFLLFVPLIIGLVRIVTGKFFQYSSLKIRKAAFIGGDKAFRKFKQWCKFLDTPLEIVGKINNREEGCIGDINDLGHVIEDYRIDELIFDSGDDHFKDIYAALVKYGNKVKFRIAGEKDFGIIGSDRSDLAGKVYLIDFEYRINIISSKILKRSFDMLSSIGILLTFPIWLFYKSDLIKDACHVFLGNYTWVGYAKIEESSIELPGIKTGIFTVTHFYPQSEDMPVDYYEEQNLRYAKNYSIFVDLELLLKHLFRR